MNHFIDVTNSVDFLNPDDECLLITKCVCGVKFDGWEFNISIYQEDPYECPNCKAKLFFSNGVKVYQIK